MSLITQCPACSTMFRVVPDQLRVSEGWVRCGQCDEVFDANAHLHNLDPLAPPPAVQGPPEAASAPASPAPDLRTAQADAYDWGPVLQAPAPSAPPAAEPVAAEPADPVLSASPQDYVTADTADYSPSSDAFLAHNPHAQESVAVTGTASLTGVPVSVWPEPQASDGELRLPGKPSAAEPDQEPALSFMPREPDARASKWARLGWGLTAGLLTLLLALQLVVAQRDTLAVQAPALRPAVLALCAQLGCVVSAPRRIESIAIESSSFSSLKPGVYLLSLTLKSTADTALASPALELTLTDSQDQALARKVIPWTDFSSQAEMAAMAELSASVPLSVGQGVPVERIAGYKLLAFYP